MDIDEQFSSENATSEGHGTPEVAQPEVAASVEAESEPVLGRMPSPFVLGIDLGTCNSAIAVFQRNEAVLIHVDGEKSCPSVMAVNEGEVMVGKRAKGRILIDPDNVVASVKRYIGNGEWVKVFSSLPDKEFRPKDIAAEILAKLVNAAQLSNEVELNGTPKKVVICVPANFKSRKR